MNADSGILRRESNVVDEVTVIPQDPQNEGRERERERGGGEYSSVHLMEGKRGCGVSCKLVRADGGEKVLLRLFSNEGMVEIENGRGGRASSRRFVKISGTSSEDGEVT